MNTNDPIFVELQNLVFLYNKYRRKSKDLYEFDDKISEERQKLERKLSSTTTKKLKSFQSEQIKKLPRWPGVGYDNKGNLKNYPPIHWAYASMPELRAEKVLETWFSSEQKTKFYNAFREYEKSFVKIKKICERVIARSHMVM